MSFPKPSCRRAAAFVLLMAFVPALVQAEVPAARVTFNRDIRPIISANCFACHGPDKSQRKAKLRLDDQDSALARKIFDLKNPDQSKIVRRIFSTDPKEIMPPPESHKRLTEAQKQTLRQWVRDGAKYEPFWAYVVSKRPAVPRVRESSWVRNPIDAFILHTLEQKKIAHSPEADRRTLLRRVSLDLIGLPPTPEQMQAFLDDHSPDAYEKQVDRLLASPHYGERMAVPWLDAVRFADTVGYHGDQNQDVFPYRDYVIDSFNHNEPFDQFTIEQIAGDLLPHPTTEQLVATCFNRLNMVTREGGAQPKEYLAKYMADRVRTIGSAFLGSTLNCCECHDHKYDPFTARDFYSMGAFFADVKQWGVYMDYSYTPNPDLKGFSNDSPFPPEIVVDSPYLHRRRARLLRQIDRVVALSAAALGQDAQAHERFDDWGGRTRDFLKGHPDGWAVVAPVGLAADNADHAPVATDEQSILFPPTQAARSRKAGAMERIAFALQPGTVAAIRLQLLPSQLHHGSIMRDGQAGGTVKIAAFIKSASGAMHRARVYYADADFKDDVYSNGYPIIGVTSAWQTSAEYSHATQTAVYVLAKPIAVSKDDRLIIAFNRNGPGCARVAVSPIAPLNPKDRDLSGRLDEALASPDAPLAADGSLIKLTYLLSTAWDPPALAQVRQLNQQVLECRDGKSPVMVTVSVPPYVTRVLPRGNWQDQSGPIVEPAVPHFLAQPHVTGRRLNRLDLARWLVSPQNPLTSRVIVNRLWKQFFGAGICNTVQDFGEQGEWPMHPELLDWLAVEFRESGWDVKHMVRLMVTSSTYRQDSNLPPSLRETDPGDRLLAAQMPRRLAAEFIRDNALFAAGLLNLDMGGPSIHPYQPAGYYATIQFPSRKYVPDTDARQWRRGVYIHWQRSFLHPMLQNFDAPSREDGICTRNVSNTPQQALTLLNDPEFVEAARVLAGHVLAQISSDDAARLNAIYERVLCRPPTDVEQKSLAAFLAQKRAYYEAHVDDAGKLTHTGIAPVPANIDESQLAAWTSVCRVVLNLHESITRY